MNKKTGNFTGPRNELVRNVGAFDSIRKFKNTKIKNKIYCIITNTVRFQ